jgi:hypothetical protein
VQQESFRGNASRPRHYCAVIFRLLSSPSSVSEQLREFSSGSVATNIGYILYTDVIEKDNVF